MSNCEKLTDISNLTNFNFIRSLRCHYKSHYEWLYNQFRDNTIINLQNPPEEIINISGIKTFDTKWSTKIERLPKFLYDFVVDPDNKYPINNLNDFTAWSKTLGLFITGNKFIDFDGNTVVNNSDYYLPIPDNLCIGCWFEDCDKKRFLYSKGKVQTFIDGYIEGNFKPYEYIQCYYFGLIMYSFCRLRGINAKIIAGNDVTIDINHNYKFDNSDSYWIWHIWNEIEYDGVWYAFDCCPGLSMNLDKPFVKGPIALDRYSKSTDLKYFMTYGLINSSHIYTLQDDKFDDLSERYNNIRTIMDNNQQVGGTIVPTSSFSNYEQKKYFTILKLIYLIDSLIPYSNIIDVQPTINYILAFINTL